MLCLLLTASGCETSGGPDLAAIAETVNKTFEGLSFVFGVGDQLDVRFANAPTWNHQTQVTQDGSASFVGIGPLAVAGMSPSKLHEALERAYKDVLPNPQVDVAVRVVGPRNVYVMGEVMEPGEVTLAADRKLTLLQAIAQKGGPIKQSAYLAHLLLVRISPSTGKQQAWTIDAREEYWCGETPLYLQPYDVVWIPNTPIDDVDIWIDNYIRRVIPFPYPYVTAVQ
jgi:protein involved in polysaccharide export with SLBB domain